MGANPQGAGPVLPDDYFSVPHTARVWNYWMGGRDNYPVDRAHGDEVARLYPGIRDMVRQGRLFQRRVVRYLVEQRGLRQILDVGTGFPVGYRDNENTHEIVESAHPDARVVYVDNDPVVLAHARALLVSWTERGVVDYVDADVHDPDDILSKASSTLDFTEPVAVLFLGVLGHVAEIEEARGIVARIMSATTPGSCVAIRDGINADDTFRAGMQQFSTAGMAPYYPRTPEELTSLFGGLELIEPGVVSCSLWDPGHLADVSASRPVPSYAGVARKTASG
jgi:hypothetical protein